MFTQAGAIAIAIDLTVSSRMAAITVVRPVRPYAALATDMYDHSPESSADATSRKLASADSPPTRMRMAAPSTTPHCEKKKGMETMPAPRVVFDRLNIDASKLAPPAEAVLFEPLWLRGWLRGLYGSSAMSDTFHTGWCSIHIGSQKLRRLRYLSLH